MPKAIKKRAEKKVHQGDEVREAIIDIKERLRQRQRTLVYAIVGLLIATAVTVVITVYLTTSKTKSADFAFEGYKLYYSNEQILGMTSFEKYQKALDMFKKSYESKKTPHALLYIANCYYELANYDDAIKTLNDLNNQFSDPKINSIAYYKLAMSYLKKGDSDNAINALKSLYSIKGSAFSDMALLEWGKILDSQGKKEEAKEKYKELIDKFPKSAFVEEAKGRLGGN